MPRDREPPVPLLGAPGRSQATVRSPVVWLLQMALAGGGAADAALTRRRHSTSILTRSAQVHDAAPLDTRSTDTPHLRITVNVDWTVVSCVTLESRLRQILLVCAHFRRHSLCLHYDFSLCCDQMGQTSVLHTKNMVCVIRFSMHQF